MNVWHVDRHVKALASGSYHTFARRIYYTFIIMVIVSEARWWILAEACDWYKQREIAQNFVSDRVGNSRNANTTGWLDQF